MRQKLVRWLRLLSVAGPLGGCCVTSPCQGCASAAAQEPIKPVSAMIPDKVPDKIIAATVNGEWIPLDRVDAYLKKQSLGSKILLSSSQLKALRADVIEQVIEDTLLRQYFRQLGYKPEPRDIDLHLQAMQQLLKKRDGKLMTDYLRETGQTEADLRESLVFKLQSEHYLEQRASEAELRRFFAAEQDYFQNIQVKISHIVLRVGMNAPPGEKITQRERLMQIRTDIAEGKLSFAEAARKYSMCSSARLGGEIGYITRRFALVDDSVAELAFRLKVNQMGGPVESAEGLHLVFVVDRTAGVPITFEKAAEWVKETYFQVLMNQLITELRRRSTIQINLPES